MKPHELDLYTLVEISLPDDPIDGMRLFVQGYSRDFDGTPLYNLTTDLELVGKDTYTLALSNKIHNMIDRDFYLIDMGKILNNYPLNCLKVVRPSNEVIAKLIEGGRIDSNLKWIA